MGFIASSRFVVLPSEISATTAVRPCFNVKSASSAAFSRRFSVRYPLWRRQRHPPARQRRSPRPPKPPPPHKTRSHPNRTGQKPQNRAVARTDGCAHAKVAVPVGYADMTAVIAAHDGGPMHGHLAFLVQIPQLAQRRMGHVARRKHDGDLGAHGITFSDQWHGRPWCARQRPLRSGKVSPRERFPASRALGPTRIPALELDRPFPDVWCGGRAGPSALRSARSTVTWLATLDFRKRARTTFPETGNGDDHVRREQVAERAVRSGDASWSGVLGPETLAAV